MRIPASLIAAAACTAALHASTPAQSPNPAPAVTGNCVAIGSPKPTQSFAYRYSDKTSSAEYTNRWEQFTPTGSQLITTRTGATGGQSTYVSKHKVVDDVFVLEASTASGTDGNGAFTNSMTYTPGAIGDPAYRACEGKSWKVPSVNATIKSMQGSFSQKTDPGTLVIVKIHESVTVPAGTFDTVHYVKTMGQAVDDFWKSIEHGVTVKRNGRQPLSIATEVLTAVR